MHNEDTIHPHFKIVAFDDTSDWDPDIVAKTGRIWSTYLIDVNRHVHICSLTPSYEMWFIENLTEKELDDDTYELVAGVHEEPVIYTDVRDIERKPADHFTDLGEESINEDETYEDVLEWILDRVKCNQQAPKVTWSNG